MSSNRGIYPEAVWDPIRNRSNFGNKPVRMTIHTAWANSPDIYGPQKGPGGTYAHFHNPTSGKIRQHQQIHKKAYADLQGNGHTIGVEHQDERRAMPMSASQIDNDARLFAYLVKHYGVPNRIATPSNTTGLAWHRLGCAGNFGRYDPGDRTTWSRAQTGQRWSNAFGKTCPTNPRIRQIEEIWNKAQLYLSVGGGGALKPVPSKPAKKPKPAKHAKSYEWPGVNLRVDGKFGAITKRGYQRLLAGIDLYTGRIDGSIGPMSVKAEQRWLNTLGYYTGYIDGSRGPLTIRALQRFLASKGKYKGLVDGKFGPMSVKALQGYLNSQRKYFK